MTHEILAKMTVGVVGAGKVGVPLAAAWCSTGATVHLVENDPDRAAWLNDTPFREWSRESGVRAAFAKHAPASVTTDYSVLADAALVLICVPTPSLPGGAFNDVHVAEALTETIEHAPSGAVLVVTSTVQPGTMSNLAGIATEAAARRSHPLDSINELLGVTVDYSGSHVLLYHPAFIELGDVYRGFTNPNLALIGHQGGTVNQQVAETYADLLTQLWTPRPPSALVHIGGYREVEIAKLVINCALSTKAAVANLIGSLTETQGADGAATAAMVGADPRIGPAFLKPGPRPGGPCLPRDLEALRAVIGNTTHWNDMAAACDALVEGVQVLNETKNQRIRNAIHDAHESSDNPIGIVGLGYKQGVDLAEESLAEYLIGELAGIYDMVVHDPLVVLEGTDGVRQVGADYPGAVLELCDTIVIATPTSAVYQQLVFEERHTVIDPWGVVAEPGDATVITLGAGK